MSEDYPLCPELTEQGKKEAQRIMDSFKPVITKLVTEAVEAVMSDLYCNVSFYVESDHWENYRLTLLDGFKNYKRGESNHEHDFDKLRRAIWQNHRDEMIKDLNQDLVNENQELREEIKRLKGFRRRNF